MIQNELRVTMTSKQAAGILEEKALKYVNHFPMTVMGWLSEISSIDFQERIPWAVPYTCVDDISTDLFDYDEMLGILKSADTEIVFTRMNDEGSDDWVLVSIAFPEEMAYNNPRGH